MPSFLKRLSSFAGTKPSSSATQSPKLKKTSKSSHQQEKSTQPYGKQPTYPQFKDPQEAATRSQSEGSSSNASTQRSTSATPTISSASSLSLSLPDSPASIASCGGPTSSSASYQQNSEALQKKLSHLKDGSHDEKITATTQQQQHPPASSSSSQTTNMPSVQERVPRPTSPTQKMKRSSISSLSVLFHPRSRSMPMLQDPNSGFVPDQHQMKHYHSTVLSPASTTSPTPRSSNNQRAGIENLSGSAKRMSVASTVKSKKSRPMSLSAMLLQSDQQNSGPQPRLPHQVKATRWANRGGIGANEMMVGLETAGVFVPSNGHRLRAEFVYRSVIQCADEIRQRGLMHANIFTNPSPKKVITAMIALMTDQERCDLYTMQCLRIDTVASLMLNLMSQMSNPIIPYAVMEHYFQQSGHITHSSLANTANLSSPPDSQAQEHSEILKRTTERTLYSTVGDSLPVIPALPLKGTSMASSHAGYLWARDYFDLHTFLAVLPAMNRVILLEVLHLCQELLEYQIQNRLTINRLVQQMAPALFSTVFDQKILEAMSGGSKRCSVYGDSISSQDGSRAENHLFTVILVRFLHISSCGSPTVDPCSNVYKSVGVFDEGSSCSMQGVEPYGRHPSQASSSSGVSGSDYEHQNLTFRKSQQWHHQEQQEYYHQMERSFQEMEILQRPSQHFGYPPAKQDQHTVQKLKQPSSSSINVGNLDISQKIHEPLRSPSQDTNTGLNVGGDFALPEPTLESGHRDHIWRGHGRRHEQAVTIM
ncbi:hypothetical protein BKA57DRAFT_446691 [Linnemannia elongata]|nr:hypothetical protein BKA57DRAFT_446691 [Linnemannia elongata]